MEQQSKNTPPALNSKYFVKNIGHGVELRLLNTLI